MIFVLDLDGTIIDSKKRHYIVMEKILKEYNLESSFDPVDFMEYKACGNSGKQYLINKLSLSKELAKEIMDKWQDMIEDYEYMKLDELYPDTIEFMDTLNRKGYKIIFLSARKNRTNTMKQLEEMGISGYPDFVYLVSPLRATEEKIDIIKAYLDTGKELIIVGDTENEYDTAYAVGINYFVLNRGFRNKKYWDKRDVITLDDIKTLSDILSR